MLASIRTFVAGIVVPGWGYWIVGRPRHELVTAGLMISVILIISWTRLILDPVGFRVLIAGLLVLPIAAASHSAFIEYRHSDISRNWKSAWIFAGIYFIVIFLLFFNRGTILGYETFRLPSGAMAPTLLDGDQFIVDTWRYGRQEPSNGDIVVFKAPQSGEIYVKRIIGIPGDSVSLQGNQLARNGQFVREPYAIYEGSVQANQLISELRVPPNQYFLLGDNRNRSKDSRHFGMVPREDIVGRISHVYYSLDRDAGVRWNRIPTEF